MGKLLVLIAATCLILACGGSSDSPDNVKLYFTDSLSDYQHVYTTVKKVAIRHTGSGRQCDLLETATQYDLPALHDVLLLVGGAQCEEASYNRIYMEFDPTATLTNAAGVTAQCTLVSYKDNNNSRNSLSCANGVCSMEITGAVNVLSIRSTNLTLDFDLKDFEVTPEPIVAGQPCQITIKVSPVNASGGN